MTLGKSVMSIYNSGILDMGLNIQRITVSCANDDGPAVVSTKFYWCDEDLEEPLVLPKILQQATKCERSMRALYAKNAIYAARRACWGDPIVSVSGKHRKHAVQPSQKVKAKSLQLEERIKALEKQLSEEQVKVAKLEMRQRMVAYLQAVASESGDSA